MNIFYLDQDSKLCAQYHTDRHVVKMILESAQLLCTAVNVLAGSQVTPYKTTHVNHPCSVWVRESWANFIYTYDLMECLEIEWKVRYRHDNRHKSCIALAGIRRQARQYYTDWFAPLTTPALAMPDYCKISSDPVECYREYYRREKVALHKWTNRNVPYWL
jgi:hypothetical protein